MDEMREENEQSEAEAKAEIIYWATGRTKIYPEKFFAKNYAEIKARSEQVREEKNQATQRMQMDQSENKGFFKKLFGG